MRSYNYPKHGKFAIKQYKKKISISEETNKTCSTDSTRTISSTPLMCCSNPTPTVSIQTINDCYNNKNLRIKCLYTKYLNVGSNELIINSNSRNGQQYLCGGKDKKRHNSTNAMIKFQHDDAFFNIESNFNENLLLFKKSDDNFLDLKCKTVEVVSDIKYKYNIKPITNSKELIDKLNPVYWKWKENKEGSCGLIAQEVFKIIPESVKGTNNLALNYNYFIGLLISRVQEMEKEIICLENKGLNFS